MKKINKKGFTLIELLAVIIILGIVMVLTIPSVIDSMNNAKYKQLQNAANRAADWLLEQYTIYQMDPVSVNSVYKARYNDNIGFVSLAEDANFESVTVRSLFQNIQEEAGLSNAAKNFLGVNNVQYSITFYNSTKNKVCVRLQAAKNGEFFNKGTTDAEKSMNVAYSSGCPALTGSFATKWGPLVTQS